MFVKDTVAVKYTANLVSCILKNCWRFPDTKAVPEIDNLIMLSPFSISNFL